MGPGWAAIVGVLLNYCLIPLKTSPKWRNRQAKKVLRRARWDREGLGKLLSNTTINKAVGPGRGWAAVGVILNYFLTFEYQEKQTQNGLIGNQRCSGGRWRAQEGAVGPGRGWAAIGVVLNYLLTYHQTQAQNGLIGSQKWCCGGRWSAPWDQGGVGL